MLNAAPSQVYGTLRKKGHEMECAYAMAFDDAECSCKLKIAKETKRARGRPRVYATNADRQAAYRHRKMEEATNV